MKWMWDNLTKIAVALIRAGHARLATLIVCLALLMPLVTVIAVALLR